MGLAAFLGAMFEHGRAFVDPYDPRVPADDGRAVDEALRQWDAANRREFPGDAPAFDLECARWGSSQLYCAAQFAVYRDVDADVIKERLLGGCPSAPAASRIYSVDLVFRYLPDMLRLAKSAAEGDPLCDHLRSWAAAWPLSSVGVAGIDAVDDAAIGSICEEPGLLRLYVDRIILRGDCSRLASERVRRAVRTALGVHEGLAPPVAAALERYDHLKEIEVAPS